MVLWLIAAAAVPAIWISAGWVRSLRGDRMLAVAFGGWAVMLAAGFLATYTGPASEVFGKTATLVLLGPAGLLVGGGLCGAAAAQSRPQRGTTPAWLAVAAAGWLVCTVVAAVALGGSGEVLSC